jgi:hypothetical protein
MKKKHLLGGWSSRAQSAGEFVASVVSRSRKKEARYFRRVPKLLQELQAVFHTLVLSKDPKVCKSGPLPIFKKTNKAWRLKILPFFLFKTFFRLQRLQIAFIGPAAIEVVFVE